ncbi:stress responsive alpha/beta barrel protein [Frigoribacterium sp. PhB160]|uniref:Dabb family protein n=1 Tax=Frigoribacterium sp. PhB160 TaxID=2485192 RepID=UPI000F481AEB|nr:Dabb family protein [Frigoribacterium sp. PhB160]ROS61162.1 stress responsive alpha/beta barrel protein [Frigoribacterium sp. PhB160]
MIRHTVSFSLVHPAGSDAEADFLSTGARTLSAIPGVEDFVVSRQVSPKSDHAFQFAMSFADQAAYDAYDAHPDHRGFVASRWAAEVSSFQELDLVPLAPG